MKDRIGKGAAKASAFVAARPQERRWSIIGGGAGFIVGLFIGGLGVAAMGGAVGVPAAIVLAVLGAIIGNRYGISKDRPVDR